MSKMFEMKYLLKAEWAEGYLGGEREEEKLIDWFNLNDQDGLYKNVEPFLREITFYHDDQQAEIYVKETGYDIVAVNENYKHCFIKVIPVIKYENAYFELKPIAI